MTLGGRRLDLSVAVISLSSCLLWYGKLASSDYGLIICGVVAAYIAGNSYQAVGTYKSTVVVKDRRDAPRPETREVE